MENCGDEVLCFAKQPFSFAYSVSHQPDSFLAVKLHS